MTRRWRGGGGDFGVGDFAGVAGVAGGGEVGDAEGVQHMAHGAGGAAVAKDEGAESGAGGEEVLGGGKGGEEGGEGIAETDDVGVVAGEMGDASVAADADAIDGADGAGFGAEGVEVGEDALFVGDGDVEPAEFRGAGDEGGEGGEVFEFEGEVAGVYALPPELFVEVGGRVRVSEGESEDAEEFHACLREAFIFRPRVSMPMMRASPARHRRTACQRSGSVWFNSAKQAGEMLASTRGFSTPWLSM